jgi:hypothetical protein
MIASVANVFLVLLPTGNRTLLCDYRSITGWMHFSADDVLLEAICLQLDKTRKIKNCFLVICSRFFQQQLSILPHSALDSRENGCGGKNGQYHSAQPH